MFKNLIKFGQTKKCLKILASAWTDQSALDGHQNTASDTYGQAVEIFAYRWHGWHCAQVYLGLCWYHMP